MTTIVFVIGLGTGLIISSEQSNLFEDDLAILKNSIEDVELQFLFLDVMEADVSCTYLIKEAERLGQQTESMADDVDYYEKTEKISDKKFKTLKEEYTNLLIKDWLILEKIKQACEGKYVTALYFYSNNECAGCQDQGIALSFLKIKLGDDLMIFAIDSDSDLNIVKGIKDTYNITQVPSLVINSQSYYGYKNVTQLKNIICPFMTDSNFCYVN